MNCKWFPIPHHCVNNCLHIFLAIVCLAAYEASGDALADLAGLLAKQPDLEADVSALPDASILPEMAALSSDIDSDDIDKTFEEYALGTVLAGKGYGAMLAAKAQLGISRETKIESACVQKCNHGTKVENGDRRVCGACGGSGKCRGKCSLRHPSGTGNGFFRNYIIPSVAQKKTLASCQPDSNNDNCAARRNAKYGDAVTWYNRYCKGHLHHDAKGYFLIEICKDCGGSAKCRVCHGTGTGTTVQATSNATCPKCKGTGLLIDRVKARQMLVVFDKYLRRKMAGYMLAPAVAKALVIVEGDSLSCDGVAVSQNGKTYVAVPVEVLVANCGLRLTTATGDSVSLGGILLTPHARVAFLEVFRVKDSMTLAELGYGNARSVEAWLTGRSPAGAALLVAKCEPATSSARPCVTLPAGGAFAGTPIVDATGKVSGVLAADTKRTLGGKKLTLQSQTGTVIPLGGFVLPGAREVSLDEFKQQTTLLVEGEAQLLNASNILARAESSFSASKLYMLAPEFTDRIENLVATLSGEITWSIPEMAEFAAKITTAARLIIARQKQLKSEYDAYAAQMANAESNASAAQNTQDVVHATSSSNSSFWIVLLGLSALLLVAGIYLLFVAIKKRK